MGLERAYIALGSNLGDRAALLASAIGALRATDGVRVTAVSPVYETEPVSGLPQGPYLNAVVCIETTLSARALLERQLAIESAAGRRRGPEPGAPRTLDLDLLLYGQHRISEPELVVPHPRLHERAFVLEPLRDIAAELLHPVLRESIEALARRVRKPGAVRRLSQSTDARREDPWPSPQ